MEQVVSILRSKEDMRYIVHPMGIFRGYGGYAAINPCREIEADCAAKPLGELIIEMLQMPNRIPVSIQEIESYYSSDPTSNALRSQWLTFEDTKMSCRQYIHAEVSKSSRSKSWHITIFRYDAALDIMAPRLTKRILLSDGANKLGQFISQHMVIDTEERTRANRTQSVTTHDRSRGKFK